jgi:Na+/melibiose symporter-like transporter
MKPSSGWMTAVNGMALTVFMTPMLSAAPTAEEVFKSVGENVSESSNPSQTLALVLGVVGVLFVLLLISSRRKRQLTPKAVNHQGKLLKEIAGFVEIKPAQLKKLKSLADEFGARRGEPLQSPLVLMLCPSLLAEAMKKKK